MRRNEALTVTEAVTLMAAVGAFVVAITGAFVSVWNAIHLAQVHTLVNSMATRTEALQRDLGRAEGQSGAATPLLSAQNLAGDVPPTLT